MNSLPGTGTTRAASRSRAGVREASSSRISACSGSVSWNSSTKMCVNRAGSRAARRALPRTQVARPEQQVEEVERARPSPSAASYRVERAARALRWSSAARSASASSRKAIELLRAAARARRPRAAAGRRPCSRAAAVARAREIRDRAPGRPAALPTRRGRARPPSLHRDLGGEMPAPAPYRDTAGLARTTATAGQAGERAQGVDQLRDVAVAIERPPRPRAVEVAPLRQVPRRAPEPVDRRVRPGRLGAEPLPDRPPQGPPDAFRRILQLPPGSIRRTPGRTAARPASRSARRTADRRRLRPAARGAAPRRSRGSC